MARSKYIYLIFELIDGEPDKLLSAHTVKYEAHEWLERSMWEPGDTALVRCRDGVTRIGPEERQWSKRFERMEWE